MNTHADYSLLRELEAEELRKKAGLHAPLCCIDCPELYAIVDDQRFDAWGPDGRSHLYGDKVIYPGCRKSEEEIDIRDEHCPKLVLFRAATLAEDLDQFTREMTKLLNELQDAMKKFIQEVA